MKQWLVVTAILLAVELLGAYLAESYYQKRSAVPCGCSCPHKLLPYYKRSLA